MTKTVIEKVASSSSEVAVFKVGGTLGYHENKTLHRFFEECKKRDICKIVLDFSDLRSVGGGCASIIQETAAQDEIVLAIVGASATVLKFLQNQAEDDCLLYASSVEEAVGTINFSSDPSEFSSPEPSAGEKHEDEQSSEDRRETGQTADSHSTEKNSSRQTASDPEDEVSGVVDEVDELLSRPIEPETPPEPSNARREDPDRMPAASGIETPHVIPLGYDGDGEARPASVLRPKEPANVPSEPPGSDISRELRALKKKVVHYNTLLSISTDFNRLEDRASLIDAFLLTAIAQIGVESAAFYESSDDSFVYAASKGIDLDADNVSVIEGRHIDLDSWRTNTHGYQIEQLPLEVAVKQRLKQYGFVYGALFVMQNSVRGIVFLGKSIKQSLDSDWSDFLRVLMTQAAISYEKTTRLEEESERTLGLVQTLISLIEENTVGKGTINLLTNYTYVVALHLQYPKEHIKDLMFGTVLRDIGMIKVSDLIVRSPRELVQEEWEIIKRHPLDGSEMLSRMNFSRHTKDIVSCHHERFNGEGYPNALEGHNIPLGARIISIVESYAAMLQDRPSRPALTEEEALQTLKENWGLRYDPDVVRAFVEIVEKEIRTGEKVVYNHHEIFKL
jgi:hypothetical protein